MTSTIDRTGRAAAPLRETELLREAETTRRSDVRRRSEERRAVRRGHAGAQQGLGSGS